MKLFKQLRKLLPFIVGYDILEEYGLVAPNEIRKSICSFTSILGCIVLVICTFLAGGYLAFEAETFDEIHDHFYEFAGAFNFILYLAYIHWMCEHFFDLNDSYEQMIKKRSINNEKHKLYKEAVKLVDLFSKYLYITTIKFLFPFTTVPYLIMSYFEYYTTDLEKDAFRLPFIMWAIFDWRTPTAYIFAFTLQFIAATYATVIGLVLLIYAFGSCWILITFIDDIKTDFSTLEVLDNKLYQHFIDFVQVHKELKQLLAKFSHTGAMPFMMDLFWTASTMTVALVSLQTELRRPEIDWLVILRDISLTFASIVLLVILCSLCEELKRRFDDLDVYRQCKWYRYPIKILRIMPIIIIDSRNSNILKVYGNITASRETCKKVINGGFLTILVLHSFLK